MKNFKKKVGNRHTSFVKCVFLKKREREWAVILRGTLADSFPQLNIILLPSSMWGNNPFYPPC